MPLRTKKWTRSKANQYISRSKACKKLQISLPSFRKLCILKGIYPHDPKKKHRKEGDRRVYYHVRDIKNLRREPILWQWRNQKTFRNKLTKHKGRHNWDKVKRMQLNIPQISIDHLVRERYPSFDDALRDLDDCITFVSLFATLPSGIIPQLTALRRMECQKLSKEFRYYIVKHGLLTKAFISVKGIYYQCKLKNKFDITWIVPHGFTHSIPDDVDYRVMSSFLDFYQTMFKFVVFKLYILSNTKYPPFGHIDYDLTSLSLTQLIQRRFTMKRKINIKNKQRNKEKNKNKNVVTLDLNKILNKEINDDESNDDLNERYSRREWDRSNLFEDFSFLLNRETPQFELEFIILSMGGNVVFEQECNTKKQRNDPSITHQIVDRKIAPCLLLNTREYVQPQWVFDCLNVGAVIPTEHYQIGIQCPPHLSPFVVYNDQSHIPSQHFVLEHWKKISKQFGGFVPSKKLGKRNKIKKVEDIDEIEQHHLNAFMDDEEEQEEEKEEEKEKEEDEEKFKRKALVLSKQRIRIANKERKNGRNTKSKHSLEVDGIPGNKEEWNKVNLARSMMAKKFRKTYDKIRRKQSKKSKYVILMEQKRKRLEHKQICTNT